MRPSATFELPRIRIPCSELPTKKVVTDYYVCCCLQLCPCFSQYGRNLDALTDVLRGGFDAFDYGEVILVRIESHRRVEEKIVRVFQAAPNVTLELS